MIGKFVLILKHFNHTHYLFLLFPCFPVTNSLPSLCSPVTQSLPSLCPPVIHSPLFAVLKSPSHFLLPAPQSHSSPTQDLQFLCSSVALSSTHCFLTSNPSPLLSAYPDFSSSQSPASATILPDLSPFYFPASVFSMHDLTLPYLHAPMHPRFDLLTFHPPASTSVTQNLYLSASEAPHQPTSPL